MMSREVAWRIFAGEFNASSLEIKGEGDRSPSYVVTPLGAMVNRMFVVGVLTDSENIGTDDEPLWRGRISDPTGIFYISAGQYQPEAAMAISKIDPPAFVAVVGKARTYSPEEGTLYLSIRPENIRVVDEAIRDYWVLDTCRQTLKRIDALADALEMESPSVDELVNLGHDPNLSEGVIKSLGHYMGLNLESYREMVIDALKYLLPEYEMEMEIPTDVSGPEEIELDEEIEDEEFNKEDIILRIIDRLDSSGKGAPWDEIVDEAGKEGIDRTELEELTNSLLDKGLIYEPVLGKMKRI
ncbi:MAG TPA: glycerol dehydrogenase [Methanomassiliicoccales archaeon]|nr:glycerol dehydrogenase [Methanomassiliicoccales archaeon]